MSIFPSERSLPLMLSARRRQRRGAVQEGTDIHHTRDEKKAGWFVTVECGVLHWRVCVCVSVCESGFSVGPLCEPSLKYGTAALLKPWPTPPSNWPHFTSATIPVQLAKHTAAYILTRTYIHILAATSRWTALYLSFFFHFIKMDSAFFFPPLRSFFFPPLSPDWDDYLKLCWLEMMSTFTAERTCLWIREETRREASSY